MESPSFKIFQWGKEFIGHTFRQRQPFRRRVVRSLRTVSSSLRSASGDGADHIRSLTEEELRSKHKADRAAEDRRQRRKQQLQACLKHVAEARCGLRGTQLGGASDEFSLSDSEGLSRYAEFFRNVFRKCVLPALLGKGVRERREIPEVLDWLCTVVEHTSLNGSNDHPVGELLVAFCEALAFPGQNFDLDSELTESACVAGWCVEMLSVAFTLQDEIVHRQVFDWRMDAECWFRRKEVGLRAISDANLLKNSVFRVLLKHFRKEHYYASLVELFEKVAFGIAVGQIQLELMKITPSRNIEELPEERFTLSNYNEAVWLRETNSTLCLPLFCAVILTKHREASEEVQRNMEKVIRELGWFRRHVLDFEDCFVVRHGETQPRCEAIRSGKCTWMAVEILERGTPEAKARLLENYGYQDKEKCKAIHDLYMEANLDKNHRATLEQKALGILELLDTCVSNEKVRDIFSQIIKGLTCLEDKPPPPRPPPPTLGSSYFEDLRESFRHI